MSDTAHRVQVTAGPHAGAVGVVIDRDPKWLLVRMSDGVWPFPRQAWIHRREIQVVSHDPTADMPDALV